MDGIQAPTLQNKNLNYLKKALWQKGIYGLWRQSKETSAEKTPPSIMKRP
jgi:hypothetical protein